MESSAAKPKLIVVLGPTAVGKSSTALRLAETLDGEIINADSQQVYRQLNIGTGKPSPADRGRIRHHLVDVVNVDEDFNAALFRRLAAEAVAQVQGRGKAAIVCGGTGLYLKALTRGLFEGPGSDASIRRQLDAEIAARGLADIYRELESIDPGVGSVIHPNDRQRIVRALEVYRLTGKPLSAWQRAHGFGERPFDALQIGLRRERQELYGLINRRSEAMIAAGLLDEVRAVVAQGFSLELKPLQSVGYRQMGDVIRGLSGLQEAVSQMQQETRRLAKRQITWFGGDPDIRWFHPEAQIKEILDVAEAFLR